MSLTDGLGAEAVRGSVDRMRDAVRRLAEEHHDVWVGPFPEMAHALTEVARVDLCLARLVEGHVDALRILDQAGASPRPGVYGVWASRSAGTGVAATPDGDGWRLTGESRFSSGIDVIDRALVPGWLDDGTHLLLDVDATAVDADRDSWQTSAMDASRSFTVRLDLPAGRNDVVGLRRFTPTGHQARRVGVMEQAVRQAGLVVDATAQRLPSIDGEALVRETAVARTTVAWACEQVLDEATRVVGPAGLSGTARLARTVADLTIYVRQHHLDLTLESLGRDALRDRESAG